jgi:hypothetical protein
MKQHKVEFFSQRGRDHENIGCGAASLMMLLRHHRLPIRVPSYRDLCECLWLTVDPEVKGWQRKWGRGAYQSDVERALNGMASSDKDYILFSKVDEKDSERAMPRIKKGLGFGPIMSAMKGKGFGAGEGHWVVITGYQDGELRYLDPWLRHGDEKALSSAAFRKHWDGCGFFLKLPCKRTCA